MAVFSQLDAVWPQGQINPLPTIEVISGADDELAAGCGAGPVHANGGEHLIHTTCRSECEIAEGSEYSALKGKAVGAWVGTRRVSNADHAPVLRHLHGRSEARCAGVQGEAAGEWIAVSSTVRKRWEGNVRADKKWPKSGIHLPRRGTLISDGVQIWSDRLTIVVIGGEAILGVRAPAGLVISTLGRKRGRLVSADAAPICRVGARCVDILPSERALERPGRPGDLV